MSRRKLPDKNFEWTADLAYAVGLLATDGCLSKDGRHITLRSCDLDQIKAFQMCFKEVHSSVGESTPLGSNRQICYRAQIANAQLYRWLLKIGIFPAKTYTLGAIAVPDEFFQDFLRGALDGDGTVTVYTDHYNIYKNKKYVYERLWIKLISASEVHMRWIQAKVAELVDIHGHLNAVPHTGGHATIWQLKFGKADSIKLFRWMYYEPSVPHLARKRRKFEKAILASQATEQHLKSGRPRVAAEPLESFPCTILDLQFYHAN